MTCGVFKVSVILQLQIQSHQANNMNKRIPRGEGCLLSIAGLWTG